jgi:hypothetical protein
MEPTEKELFDEKFKRVYGSMDAEFTLFHEKLDRILTQTTATNGRVTKVENDIICINKELLEYTFFKKYPKILIGTMVILGIIMFVEGMKIFKLF